jgi:hypothetical protein
VAHSRASAAAEQSEFVSRKNQKDGILQMHNKKRETSLTRFNATRHGMYSIKKWILPGEHTRDFDSLMAGLVETFQPVDAVDSLLIDDLAWTIWRLARIQRNDRALCDEQRRHIRRQSQLAYEQGILLQPESKQQLRDGTCLPLGDPAIRILKQEVVYVRRRDQLIKQLERRARHRRHRSRHGSHHQKHDVTVRMALDGTDGHRPREIISSVKALPEPAIVAEPIPSSRHASTRHKATSPRH